MNSSVDHKPYTTLSYADGPGYATAFSNDGERPDLTNIDTSKYSCSQSFRHQEAFLRQTEKSNVKKVNKLTGGCNLLSVPVKVIFLKYRLKNITVTKKALCPHLLKSPNSNLSIFMCKVPF